jgi:hypothetical protein
MLKGNSAVLIYIFLWFVINLLFLDSYPYMHADEPWLSGLSRQMIYEGQGDVTEPFYDLWKRYPHGLKILFHSAQIICIKLFSYSLFSVRLLSLMGGAITLFLFYRISKNLFDSQKESVSLSYIPQLGVVILSLDIQFIYASHFARQEILMTALMLGSLLPLTSSSKEDSRNRLSALISGFLIGLSLGFHPNGFVIAWPAALFLLHKIIMGKRPFKEGLLFLSAAALTSCIFIVLSLKYDPLFFSHYFDRANSLGVGDNLLEKMKGFPLFIQTIFMRKSGTYYLPPMKLPMITLPLYIYLSLRNGKKNEFNRIILAGFVGISLGIGFLGKYSPPSFVFYIPFFYLAVQGALFFLNRKKRKRRTLFALISLSILWVCSFFISVSEIRKETSPINESYKDYLIEISTWLPSDSTVLGGLSLEFYLDRGNLYHWRNLSELPAEDLSLSRYIRERGITHIVLAEEIPFIYENRPVWDILYGKTDLWYPQLTEFLSESCQLVGEFSSPAYGNRITAYRYLRDWPVKIYRVQEVKDSSRE